MLASSLRMRTDAKAVCTVFRWSIAAPSSQRRDYTKNNHPQSQQQHHHAGFRARTALAQEWLRTHGFRLAPVNPLRRDGLMSRPEDIEHTLPTTLRPLVQPLVQARLREGNSALCLPPSLMGTDEEQLLTTLLQQYCSGIGYEFMHCATDEERQFFLRAAEEEEESSPWMNNPAFNKRNSDKDDLWLWCLEQVSRAGAWERLLSRRYPTSKRFSLEGLEAGVVALNVILDTFAGDNNDNMTAVRPPRAILGTSHRGRINLLHTVLQKSVASLFHQWDETNGPTYEDITLGHSVDIGTTSGHALHVSLLAMPAHLESQDAAVAGKARGHMTARLLLSEQPSPASFFSQRQLEMDETVARSILPLVVHGDASFCGQGIVSETLQLSTFKGFDCGGTVHVILNNQIGFTGETQMMRTSRHRLVHVSDLALGIRAPVLHVNAERPQDVFWAARLATLYRQRFGKDVVLDLWGYRKHGHNEVDEPRITNVSLYQEVDRHEPVAQVFASTMTGTLRRDGDLLMERIEAEYQVGPAAQERHEQHKSGSDHITEDSSKGGEWLDFLTHSSSIDGVTGVDLQELKSAVSAITKLPDGFILHQPTQRAVSRRAELLDMLEQHKEMESSPMVDWATAELLALSTLAQEGHFCRLSGQDSQRGTFTQCHAVWHDAVTGQLHHALPPLVQVVDSPLSELGVMGFEHGFSLASPNFLVLWEAQFADFTNNSQVLIDTMISSEKEKFGLESNLVLLLPHGYDGMGPEHSSSRLERFLTLHTDTPDAAEQTEDDLERFRNSNFTVVYPSTPSNYFHVLRRSFSWPFRRPMVVLTPKRTLRLPQAASPLTEFLSNGGSQAFFSPVLDDPRNLDRNQVESLAVCSGEIFYDVLNLVEDLPKEVSQSVAILRVEQLAPFPLRQLQAMVEQYPHAQRAVWMQEEPRNMGALRFTAPFLERLRPNNIQLGAPISRPASAAPAVGNPRYHQTSQRDLQLRIADWIKQG